MKAKEKKKHLEKEAKKEETKGDKIRKKDDGDDGQVQPTTAKAPRKNRLLACLQKTCARKAGQKRRKTSSKEKRSLDELPGPSSSNLMDSTDNSLIQKFWAWIAGLKQRWTYYIQEESSCEVPAPSMMDKRDNSLIQKSWAWTPGLKQRGTYYIQEESSCEVPTPSMMDKRDNSLIQKSWAWIAGLKQRGTCYIQEKSSCEVRTPSMVDNRDNMLIQKSWAWTAGLKQRGTYYIQEESSCEVPVPGMVDNRGKMPSKGEDDEGEGIIIKMSEKMTEDGRSVKDHCSSDSSSIDLEKLREELRRCTQASQSCKYHEEISTKSYISTEKPGGSEETSSGTVPLSLESFTIHRTLGEGGCAQVLLATDVIRKECVAIKVVDKGDFTQRGYSFVERNILQLSHESPYVIHGLGSDSSDSSDSSSIDLEKLREELRRSTPASQSCKYHEEISTKSYISTEKPGGSEETSSGTVPLSLESFTIHRTLGEGGFAQVLLTTDVIRKECVAIKVVDKGDFTQRGYSFVERNILQLSHESPYVIHGLGSDSSDSSDSSSIDLEKLREELRRSTPASQSCKYHKEISTKSYISTEKPGGSEETSSGTVPLSLESFTIHRTLGEGGFAQVLLATDVIRKECVAIKVVDKRDFTQGEYSFVERNILQLSHESPYVIHGLGAFHTLSFAYYVMEVATRGDLFDFRIKNYPLDMDTVKFIMAEVVCGTQFLHRKGILHRDLKTENILLTGDGHIKITDFGLAVTDVIERTTQQCKGTLGYAAPEMVRDQAHGRGVDYFAIGVILYILLTDEHPFPGKNQITIEYSVLYHTPHYPASLTPDTVNIIERLLCKDQFQRLGVKGDIRKHPFFSDINWEDIEARRMAPPAIMMADSVDINVNETLDYAEPPNIIKSEHQKMFNQFSFVCPEWSKDYHPAIIQT